MLNFLNHRRLILLFVKAIKTSLNIPYVYYKSLSIQNNSEELL